MSALAEVDAERLIDRYAVADRLDCSAATVTRMVNEGRFIAPMEIGNLFRWREQDVNQWIAEREAGIEKIKAAAARSLLRQTRPRRG